MLPAGTARLIFFAKAMSSQSGAQRECMACTAPCSTLHATAERPTRAFQSRSLAVIRVPKPQPWVRLHRAQHGPTYFGTTGDNKFDAPDNSFGTRYVARQISGSFVEVFWRQQERRVSSARLNQYRVAEFRASRGLKLVDLAGKGLVRMGLDARLATGSYRVAHHWAKAFYDHPDGADGILYLSRHDPKQQLAALFDRTEPLLAVQQRGSLREYLREDFYALLDRYDIALL